MRDREGDSVRRMHSQTLVFYDSRGQRERGWIIGGVRTSGSGRGWWDQSPAAVIARGGRAERGVLVWGSVKVRWQEIAGVPIRWLSFLGAGESKLVDCLCEGREDVEQWTLGTVSVKDGRELTRVRRLPSTFRGQLQWESLNLQWHHLWGSIRAAPSSLAVGMEKMSSWWL